MLKLIMEKYGVKIKVKWMGNNQQLHQWICFLSSSFALLMKHSSLELHGLLDVDGISIHVELDSHTEHNEAVILFSEEYLLVTI